MRGRFPNVRPVSKQTRLIILTVVATLLGVAILQNIGEVPIRFIRWEARVPHSLFLLFVVGLGFIGGLFWRRR